MPWHCAPPVAGTLADWSDGAVQVGNEAPVRTTGSVSRAAGEASKGTGVCGVPDCKAARAGMIPEVRMPAVAHAKRTKRDFAMHTGSTPDRQKPAQRVGAPSIAHVGSSAAKH